MDPSLAIAMAIGLIVLVFAFVIGIAVYIFHSIGLYRLAKNQGIENAWLAWIPIGNYYIIGTVAKKSNYIKTKIPRLDMILPICGAVYVALSFVPSIINIFASLAGSYASILSMGISSLVISLLGLCFTAFLVFVYYHIYKLYDPNNAVLFTVLSVFGFAFIFIFIIRNKQPVLQEENKIIQQ